MFVWNEFGVLGPHQEDDWYLYAVNEDGVRRQISKGRYPNYPKIREKLEILLGKRVQLRTSQNTSEWSTDKWFSDVSLANTFVKDEDHEQNFENVNELKKKVEDQKLELMNLEEIKLNLQNNNKILSEKLEQEGDLRRKVEYENIEFKNLLSDISVNDQDKHRKQGDILTLERKIIGKQLEVKIKMGHATKTLALRVGVVRVSGGRIKMEIMSQYKRNVFSAKLLDYANITCRVALMYENTDYLATTFLSDIDGFEEALEIATGRDSSFWKTEIEGIGSNESNLSKVHQQVIDYIHQKP
jgi:hypothetical protein